MLLKGQELFSTDSKLGEAWTVGKLEIALLYDMQSMYGGLWQTLLDNLVTACVTGVIKKTLQLNFQLLQLILLSCSQIVFSLLGAHETFLQNARFSYMTKSQSARAHKN